MSTCDRGVSRPLVSVVVPVLNDAPGITACLEALLAQTYPPDGYEVIVADNGSVDGTRAAVERLGGGAGGRLRLVVEDGVRTSYAARNRGVRAARGRIVAFTDADCVPARTWLECGVRALQAEPAAGVAGRIVVTYRGDRPNAYEYWDSAIRFNQRAYVERHYGATANLFVHADVLVRHGAFLAGLVSGGDREFGTRLWQRGERLVYAPDAVVLHPARATLGAVYRKSVRLGRAQRPLHRLGVARRWECAGKLVRSWRCPSPRDWTGRLSPMAMAKVRLLHHLNAWLRVAACLAEGVGGAWRHRWRAPGPGSSAEALPSAAPRGFQGRR